MLAHFSPVFRGYGNGPLGRGNGTLGISVASEPEAFFQRQIDANMELRLLSACLFAWI